MLVCCWVHDEVTQRPGSALVPMYWMRDCRLFISFKTILPTTTATHTSVLINRKTSNSWQQLCQISMVFLNSFITVKTLRELNFQKDIVFPITLKHILRQLVRYHNKVKVLTKHCTTSAIRIKFLWVWYVWPSSKPVPEMLVTQVTWLIVTEVWSESFGLITEHRHHNGRHVTERRHYNSRHRGPVRNVTEGDCDDHRVWYRALSLR